MDFSGLNSDDVAGGSFRLRSSCLEHTYTEEIRVTEFVDLATDESRIAIARNEPRPACYNPRERNSMTDLIDVVVQTLRKEHHRLSKEIKAVSAALSAFGAAYGKGTARRRSMSAAGRARIAAAQRARWAKARAKSGNANVVIMPKKRTMSASARKRIAAAQRARWAKVKTAKKSA